jgi:glycosyltransferase involved in cell wall biosynthesis
MRIAYIAPYQGPGLVRARPTVHNLSLAARVKISLIAELLKNRGHHVDVLAQGEVALPHLKFYPAFLEPETFAPDIPIHYASALPIRGVNGLWSAFNLLRLFKKAHRNSPYDLVVIYNLKMPQIVCARHALRIGLPVVLQYEDDSFADVWGNREVDLRSAWQRAAIRRLFASVSACIAVSPYLLSQLPSRTPKLLLRGVVSEAIAKRMSRKSTRKNWVVFSGTLERKQGLDQLITAWKSLRPQGWELHIAGTGAIREQLHTAAAHDPSIIFHGVLDREQNAQLLCTAKIGMNPQDTTQLPGNAFAFKIVEYLAAGLRVVTTPRGVIESELEAGITFIPDNRPQTIAQALGSVIHERRYDDTAEEAALRAYGPSAVSHSLSELISNISTNKCGDERIRNRVA